MVLPFVNDKKGRTGYVLQFARFGIARVKAITVSFTALDVTWVLLGY